MSADGNDLESFIDVSSCREGKVLSSVIDFLAQDLQCLVFGLVVLPVDMSRLLVVE